MSAAVAGALGASIATVIVGLAGLIAVRRKTKAETVDLITESAERIILRLEAIINRLEAEGGMKDGLIADLRSEVDRLRSIIRQLGHDPDSFEARRPPPGRFDT